MPGKKYIIVDCEYSVLLYSLRQMAHYPSVFINLKTKLKDKFLPSVLSRLSKDPNVSIIIVTAHPYTRLLEKYLAEELSEIPFSIVYAPPLHQNKETITQNEKINITPASISPPPGYTLLFNHTLSAPKGGWENYAKILWQRLANTDYFCKLQEQQDLEQQELERKELERQKIEREKIEQQKLEREKLEQQELEQKERKNREKKEEKLSISLGEHTSSLRFFTPTVIFSAQMGTNVRHSLSPETVGSAETRATMTPSSSHMQHIIEKTSSSNYFKRIVGNEAQAKKTPPPCRIQCIKEEEAQNPSGSFRSYSPSALSSS